MVSTVDIFRNRRERYSARVYSTCYRVARPYRNADSSAYLLGRLGCGFRLATDAIFCNSSQDLCVSVIKNEASSLERVWYASITAPTNKFVAKLTANKGGWGVQRLGGRRCARLHGLRAKVFFSLRFFYQVFWLKCLAPPQLLAFTFLANKQFRL